MGYRPRVPVNPGLLQGALPPISVPVGASPETPARSDAAINNFAMFIGYCSNLEEALQGAENLKLNFINFNKLYN